MRSLAAAAFAVLAACAPTVEAPLEAQRARDRDDAAQLAHQLGALPGATSASVTLHRPARDPLATTPASPPSAAVLVVVDADADRAHLAQTVRTLVRATAPEIPEPTIVVEPGAPRVQLADVGPFRVAAGSQRALKLVLALALVAIAALAIAVAYYRRGTSAQ